MLHIVISKLLSHVRRDDEEGQTLVEYGLLLALIVLIVLVALVVLGPIVSELFERTGDSLDAL